MVTVRYTGERYMPMTYHIYVNGQRHNGQGYKFGARPGHDTAVMSQEEADVLTGVVDPLYADGQPVNAVVPKGRVAGDESWEVVAE